MPRRAPEHGDTQTCRRGACGGACGCCREPVPWLRPPFPTCMSVQTPESPRLVLREQEDGQSPWPQVRDRCSQNICNWTWGPAGHPQRLEGPGHSLQSPSWEAASPRQDPEDTMRSEPCLCRDHAPPQEHVWVPTHRLRIYPKDSC